jgi:hypothetical protein
VVTFLVGGVNDLLSQNFRYKIKPAKMQNKTAEIARIAIITAITVFFDILGGDFAFCFNFGSAKPHFLVKLIKKP